MLRIIKNRDFLLYTKMLRIIHNCVSLLYMQVLWFIHNRKCVLFTKNIGDYSQYGGFYYKQN
jgi:hypothetical protein